jgi:GMP synthase (glutamine-hydrolysing)
MATFAIWPLSVIGAASDDATPMPRILIADGAPSAWQARLSGIGLPSNQKMFETAVQLQDADTICVTVNIADGEMLPSGSALMDYDAVMLTGSPLHVYDTEPPVTRQIDFLRAAFATDLPVWGSCWGLQLATVVLGGSVRGNPQGREFGIARRITLTDAGRAHAVLGRRPIAFDALCSHLDEVETLPPGAQVLAGNVHSAVQAMAAPTPGGGHFLGVQYHPEHDLTFSASLLRARADVLVDEGLVRDSATAHALAVDFHALHEGGRPDLAWRYGVDDQVLDPQCRTGDIGGWLMLSVGKEGRWSSSLA